VNIVKGPPLLAASELFGNNIFSQFNQLLHLTPVGISQSSELCSLLLPSNKEAATANSLDPP
jgi:hypothetical protein